MSYRAGHPVRVSVPMLLLWHESVCRSFSPDRSRDVIWFFQQVRLVTAVLCDTSRLVSWLDATSMPVSSVLADRSTDLSALLYIDRLVSFVLADTSIDGMELVYAISWLSDGHPETSSPPRWLVEQFT